MDFLRQYEHVTLGITSHYAIIAHIHCKMALQRVLMKAYSDTVIRECRGYVNN